PGFLASHIPFSSIPLEQPSGNLHSFFVNLLPEGIRLQLLMESGHLAKDDLLGLLLKVGWDSIGDVAVVPHGADPSSHKPAVDVSEMNHTSFWEAFYQGISNNPDAAIPGVQEKVSSSTVAFGVRRKGFPGAILKLNPKRYPLLVQNEAFFLSM